MRVGAEAQPRIVLPSPTPFLLYDITPRQCLPALFFCCFVLCSIFCCLSPHFMAILRLPPCDYRFATLRNPMYAVRCGAVLLLDQAAKLKKKRRQAKRRNYVEFPAPENN